MVSVGTEGTEGRGAQWPHGSMSRAPEAVVSKALEQPTLGTSGAVAQHHSPRAGCVLAVGRPLAEPLGTRQLLR